MFAKLCRLWHGSEPALISAIVGHLAPPQDWPPPSSIRGAAGRGSQPAPLGPNQLAWIAARLPKVSEIAGQAAAAAAHSAASRLDRQGRLIRADQNEAVSVVQCTGCGLLTSPQELVEHTCDHNDKVEYSRRRKP